MTESEFNIVQNKFEIALESLISACEDFELDINEMLSEVLLDHNIEL